tara:strand:+ start:1100 stop:1345 length:246 start_codon:yes stop_codon:yes gene_type:complete
MNTYYILLTDDGPEELMFDSNILGEESFGKFYTNTGMKSLHAILNRYPELINDVEIVTDTGVKFTITEFLDRLDTLKVLFN